jgi:hypothetical protein
MENCLFVNFSILVYIPNQTAIEKKNGKRVRISKGIMKINQNCASNVTVLYDEVNKTFNACWFFHRHIDK